MTEIPKLEEQCSICCGSGRLLQDVLVLSRLADGRPAISKSIYAQCEECAGSGLAPTEMGEAVLELVRHHLRELLEEAGVPQLMKAPDAQT